MPVELNPNYPSDLDAATPVNGDFKSEGDDNFRNLKRVLKNTLPNVTGAITATHTELNVLDGLLTSTAELNLLDGLTATAAELNHLDGITSSVAELNILTGVTATAAELNALDGITATVTELNYTDGVTSPIQTQLDSLDTLKAPLASPTFTGVPTAPTAVVGTGTTQIATTAFVAATSLVSALPGQTGHAGGVVTTDGTNASWADFATQAEMEAGAVADLRGMSPLRVAQAINALTNINRSARTGDAILTAADRGNLIDYTSGTFTQTFTAAATLGDGWFCYIRNSGTGVVTLDPNGAETIDGLASFAMYSNEARLITCTGAAFFSVVVHPFKLEPSATMNFIEPPGYRAYEVFLAAPGGGGGAGRRGAAATSRSGGGGGGAGGTVWASIRAATPGATIALTVGADGAGAAAVAVDDTAGASGTAGGTHSFGALLAAVGGSGGVGGDQGGGGTGGAASAAPAGMIAFTGTAGGATADGGAATAGLAGATWAATGGGGGGAIDNANTARDGGAGGISGTNNAATQLAGGTAGVANAAGGNGNSSVALRGGSGGGGGGAHAANAGAAGGNGVRGGGGGGGAASVNGVASGAGGNGGGYFYVGGLL